MGSLYADGYTTNISAGNNGKRLHRHYITQHCQQLLGYSPEGQLLLPYKQHYVSDQEIIIFFVRETQFICNL
jgi:hypothetical protein